MCNCTYRVGASRARKYNVYQACAGAPDARVLRGGPGVALLLATAAGVLDDTPGYTSPVFGLVLVVAVLVGGCGAAGYGWGRWTAVFWVGVVPWTSASLISDAAWMTGLWDRSSEYEPLPASMFVIPIGVPVLAIATAIGNSAQPIGHSPVGAPRPE